MKAILVMDSISRAGGGLLDAERCLHQGMVRLGIDTSVFALEDSHSAADLPGWLPLKPKAFPHLGPGALGASPVLGRAVLEGTADLIYRAGLWRLPSKYAHEWSRKHGKPEIIAPHGMLDPWAVRNSRWKKRLAHLWFEGAHLRDAACIRALCESEVGSIRAYGLKNPVCNIPNGIDLPTEKPETRSQRPEKKVLLFLGRLHPKKGLPNALRAWAKIRGQGTGSRGQEEWRFVIAGWDQGGHEAELQRLCKDLGLAYAETSASDFTDNRQPTADNGPSVVFTGPAFGATKDQLLRQASAFILPSFSEGLPMSVLEAWSYRLPVLMTEHCNLPEGFAANAALRIGTEVESIAEGLRELFSLPITDNRQLTTSLASLGDNGRQLVSERFTWPQVAAQMKEVYEWVLGGGEVPGCVRKF
jgi:poly(glycerol-phosphate) alpha-glucosyltransferase